MTEFKTMLSTLPSRPRPARMQTLSCLPVFFTLTGKPVFVVGTSDAAAWKAELLHAAGAVVTVIGQSDQVTPEMRDVLGASRNMDFRELDWRTTDFGGAALVIADVASDDAAELVACVHGHGVTVNVIDQPAFCDFQFGSIVNRSPVVVSISTSGAAPILGQAIRRRIETLLPDALSAWGSMALKLRDHVMHKLAAGPQRRSFWEAFVDQSMKSTSLPPAAEDVVDVCLAAASHAAGQVTLVGAGPGDAELLTLKAVRALQAADVILFDDLVSGEVLELARREANRICVGKRGGRESCKQEYINGLMLKLARQGKHVVRLKSGDPMIFGRAGEEIAMLEQHDIAVSVVPGISAGIALASRIGVSLTHREMAQSVQFVTGHSRDGALPETADWQRLANEATTSIFYMCKRTLPEIVGRLVENGLASDTPAVLAANLSSSCERIWRTDVAGLVQLQAELGTNDVALLAVGRALAVRDRTACGAETLRAMFA